MEKITPTEFASIINDFRALRMLHDPLDERGMKVYNDAW